MLTKNTIYQRMLASMLVIFITTLFSFSAQAASCKEKSKSSCSAASDCSWVSGYKRKDGVSVSGHCRTKANNSAATKKNSSKNSSKNKDKKDKKDKK